jgi:hypothetical protein
VGTDQGSGFFVEDFDVFLAVFDQGPAMETQFVFVDDNVSDSLPYLGTNGYSWMRTKQNKRSLGQI